MPALATTTIKLIEPPRPSKLRDDTPLTDEESALWRRVNEWMSNARSLKRLRLRAAGASLDKLKLAGDILEANTRTMSIERAEQIGRLARGLAREADKLKYHARLRAFEDSLVAAGLAERIA